MRKEEKHYVFVRELLSTFCPPGGNVLDSIAHTMTTDITCLFSGRQCVLLEENSSCFSLAISRIEEIARAKQKAMQNGIQVGNIDVYCSTKAQDMEQREDSDVFSNDNAVDGSLEIKQHRASGTCQGLENLATSNSDVEDIEGPQSRDEGIQQEGGNRAENRDRSMDDVGSATIQNTIVAPGLSIDVNEEQDIRNNQRENTEGENGSEASSQERPVLEKLTNHEIQSSRISECAQMLCREFPDLITEIVMISVELVAQEHQYSGCNCRRRREVRE